MSDPGKAVFLSYASQDAEAAKRICETLRAAGIEVWFDQSELVGGDAWDQKIRKQIKDCALLIPIISAATQARTEGYFRLEWRLADQRTHLMAKGRAFLLPVVIDATRDSEAQVPDSFTEVQWTRLPGGETPPAFAARVRKLLGGTNAGFAAPEGSPARGQPGAVIPASARSPKWLRPILVSAVIASAVVAWMLAKIFHPSVPDVGPTTTPASPAAPLSEARQLVAKARVLFQDGDDAKRENFFLADELLKKAIALDSSDADAWAAQAQVSARMWALGYVRTPAHTNAVRVQAERALALAPDSLESGFAYAAYLALALNGPSRAESIQRFESLIAKYPADHRLYRGLALAITLAGGTPEESIAASNRADALPGGDAVALVDQAMFLFWDGHLAEAEATVARSLARRPTGRAQMLDVMLKLCWRGDLDGAAAAVNQWQPWLLAQDRGAFVASTVWMWRGEPDKALAVLRSFSRDTLVDAAFTGPRAVLTARALELAGREDAARTEWAKVVQVADAMGAGDDNEGQAAQWRAVALVRLGRIAEATQAFRVMGGLKNPMHRDGCYWWPIWSGETGGATLGSEEEAFEAFLQDVTSKDANSSPTPRAALRLNPAFAAFRKNPRFAALLTAAPAPEAAAPAPSKETVATPKADAKSVAVLAFANLSDDKANEYFSDGISEELLNVLAKVPGLKVSARTSAFYFKGKEVPIPEIARQLGVAYVVEGSVRKQGDKVRITAQLIKAADGFHVWSDTFTRDLKDVFAVQDEIAGLIAKNLELKIGVVAAARTVDPEAYRLYLEALPEITSRTFAALDRAEQLITRAIARDAGLVPAQAALAVIWTLRGQQRGVLRDEDSPLARRIVAQAEMAVKLGPDWAEAQAACGFAYSVTLRFNEAIPFLRRAIEFNPSYAPAYLWLGRNYLAMGRMDEALVALRHATELDPLSHRALDNFAMTLMDAGRPQEALEPIDRALRIQPDSAQAQLTRAEVLARMGRLAEAMPIAKQWVAVEESPNTMYAIEVFALAGKRAELEDLLSAPRAIQDLDRFYILVALGRTDEALAAFEQSKVDWAAIDFLLFNPLTDPFRRHPRFLAKLQAIGLTEAHERAQAWRAANLPGKPEAKQ